MHREYQASHRRVNELLKDSPAGATKHATGNAFSRVTSKTAAENHDIKAAGSRAPKRYARGGKVKGNTTNIIIAGGEKAQPQPVPVPVPAGGPAPGGPPPGAGGPPPGGPPMMPRKSGGRIPGGESTKKNLDAMSKRAESNSYARGGKITAGAESGVGRLQKARIAKRK
jgi:hypothetical protein